MHITITTAELQEAERAERAARALRPPPVRNRMVAGSGQIGEVAGSGTAALANRCPVCDAAPGLGCTTGPYSLGTRRPLRKPHRARWAKSGQSSAEPATTRNRPKWMIYIHPTVKLAIEARAEEEGISSSHLIERMGADYCGVPRPARPPNDRGAGGGSGARARKKKK